MYPFLALGSSPSPPLRLCPNLTSHHLEVICYFNGQGYALGAILFLNFLKTITKKTKTLEMYNLSFHFHFISQSYTVCPGSSDPLYIVTYYIKWVTTSWTHSILTYFECLFVHLVPARWKKMNVCAIHYYNKSSPPHPFLFSCFPSFLIFFPQYALF